MIAGDIGRHGSDYVCRKIRCGERRVQAFAGRRPGDGFESEQVGYGPGRRWKLKVGSVYHLLDERSAASHLDGLRAVIGFAASGAACCAGLSAANVFGAGQFIAGVVDDFIGLKAGSGIGAKACDLARKNHQHENQKSLQQQGCAHTTVRENTVRGLSGQTRAGAREGRRDGSDEFLPARRPLNQELRSLVELGS